MPRRLPPTLLLGLLLAATLPVFTAVAAEAPALATLDPVANASAISRAERRNANRK